MIFIIEIYEEEEPPADWLARTACDSGSPESFCPSDPSPDAVEGDTNCPSNPIGVLEDELSINLDIDDQGYDLNECEKQLVNEHRNAAFKLAINKNLATNVTQQFFGYNGIQDCSDAFRHTYFNAINAKALV